MTTEIGVATLLYNEQGRVESAEFVPTLAVRSTEYKDLIPQFKQLSADGDIKSVEENAGLLLGAWFEKVDTIELADRDQLQVMTETILCERREDGSIRECKLKFVLAPVIQPS